MKLATGILIILVMGFLTFCASWILILGIILVLQHCAWWVIIIGTVSFSYLIIPYLLKWVDKE